MNQKFKELLDEGRINPNPIFTKGGKQFYTFSRDGGGMSQRRFEAFSDNMHLYESFRVDREDIDLYFEMKERIDLQVAMEDDREERMKKWAKGDHLKKQIQARMDLAMPMERTIEFATFLYFDESENPLMYDVDYNKEKRNLWRGDAELFAFFLAQQLPTFLNLSNFFQKDFLNSMREANLENALALRIALAQTGGNEAESEIRQNIELRLATLLNYDTCLMELLKNTIATQKIGLSSKKKKQKV